MVTVQYAYEDFTRYPSLAHRLIGIYMLDSPASFPMFIYRWICIVSHGICMGCMIFRIFEGTTINSLSAVMRYTFLTVYAINSDIKFATSEQRDAIRKLSAKLASLYPKSAKARSDHCVNQFYWPRPMIVGLIVYLGSSAIALFSPFLQSMQMYFFQQEDEMQYLHFYPFFKVDSIRRYLVVCVLEWIHAKHMIVSNITTDLWLFCFQVQLCIHFKYLSRTLQEFQPHFEHDQADRKFLIQLIDKHNYLIQIQKDINRIFGGSLLFSLLTTAGVICTVATHGTRQGINVEGISYMSLAFTIAMQLYLVCRCGQLVKSLSADIAYAAYSHNWYNASLSYKKYLVIIILRAQRPVELSAMGYMPISMETFKQLMNMTYRVFTLLRQSFQ